MEITEWKNGDCLISSNKSKIDLNVIHAFLSHSYWAENIPIEVVRKSISNSLCFGMYRNQVMIGFARVISDFATFAYLADVFIVPQERGRGLASWMMEVILEHQELQGLRRFILATKDAHNLYSRFGFVPFDKPERWMQKHNAAIYSGRKEQTK